MLRRPEGLMSWCRSPTAAVAAEIVNAVVVDLISDLVVRRMVRRGLVDGTSTDRERPPCMRRRTPYGGVELAAGVEDGSVTSCRAA